MNNLARFTGITVVLIIASLLILAVGGVLSSSAVWHNVLKVVELIAILFVTASLVIFFAKK